MIIKELLTETEDHIRLYWILKGFNIDSYHSLYDNYINMKNVKVSKNLLIELFSHVDALLRDESWQYLESDPDFDKTYDKLLDLHDSIKNYLEKI